MKVNLIFKKYLEFIALTRSAGTKNWYCEYLNHFVTHSGIKCLEDINEEVLSAYFISKKTEAGNSTLNKSIGIIRRALNYYNIEIPYINNLKRLKESVVRYQIVEAADLGKILRYCDKLPQTKNNLTYSMLINSLIDTGARISELLNAKIEDAKIYNRDIVLKHTKSSIERSIPFSEYTSALYQKRIDTKVNSDYLFYNFTKKRPYSYEDVVSLFRKLMAELHINTLHSHMFRHTFATTFLETNGNIFALSTLLGHSNVTTTMRYLHENQIHNQKLAKAYLAAIQLSRVDSSN